MKILLDECVPSPLHQLLPAHSCTTAQRQGWGGKKNWDLLRLAEAQFDLFITSDQNIQYQQNRKIAIVLLSTNKIRLIAAEAEKLRLAVEHIHPGEFNQITLP
jgi:predicted nuclease of predicted toxin-antitoxin system